MIGNTGTTDLNLGGTLYRTGGGGAATDITTYTASSTLSGSDGTGNIDVNATADVKFQTTDGDITFATALIELANGADLTVDANDTGDISVYGVDVDTLETVTLKTSASGGAGLLTVGAGGIGNSTRPANDVTLTASTVTLIGDITTSGTSDGALAKGDAVSYTHLTLPTT